MNINTGIVSSDYLNDGTIDKPQTTPTNGIVILTATPHPATIEFNHSRVLLRSEQLVYDNENNSVCNMIWVINNGFIENFYDNAYHYQLPYSKPALSSAHTLATPNKINRIDSGIPGNNILEGVFDSGLCENSIDNKICNDMFDCYFFWKKSSGW